MGGSIGAAGVVGHLFLVMILDMNALRRLADACAPLDRFGPGSARPLIAVEGAEGDDLAAFVRTLPCPVVAIGGGEGQLAAACDVAVADRSCLARIAANVVRAPLAAMVLVQHLRASEALPPEDALMAESFAYATLQHGPEFRKWYAGTRPAESSASSEPLRIARDRTTLALVMDDPATRNAIGVGMRDALAEAFDLALADPWIERITLTGAGRCFSTGGHVAEFGLAADPATAHWVRSLRLPAARAARLEARLAAHVDGAAIGAGIEIAAFAGNLTATPRSWFQLPELTYGLIPGAGGTVSISRRVGRQRTAYLALSMCRLPAHTALDWGLIDAIVE